MGTFTYAIEFCFKQFGDDENFQNMFAEAFNLIIVKSQQVLNQQNFD
jgi:hypothetical protein